MSMLASELPGARVLDLFAGSGALGLESLSRGAARAVFVERDRRALECLRRNLRDLAAEERGTVVATDVFEYLGGLGVADFDVAFADPPYDRGLAAKVLDTFRARPFARILSLEYRAGGRLDLPEGARERTYGETAIALIGAPLEPIDEEDS